MILIADSGATKAHWCLMAANRHTAECYTEGLNPIFQTVETMQHILSNQLLPALAKHLWAGTITHVFFYGAGCTPEKSPLVAQAIETIFRKAKAQVYSDMLGAARGLLGPQQGIACILGTGSNSCLYDGQDIVRSVPSLGFILGDEGAASTLGKRLVSDLLKNQLGDDLREQFLTQYAISQADIIEHVYRQPMPNRWLAHLARFCAEHIEDTRIHQLVYRHFDEFVQRVLLQYYTSEEKKTTMPVSFVGSVAYYYRPILEEVLTDYSLHIGTIAQDPIQGLITYHRPDAQPTIL